RHRVAPAPGIGIVVEGDARRTAGPGDRLQRLSAEARTADAKHGDVGCVLEPGRGGSLRRRNVVGAVDDVEKLERLRLLLLAQPGERGGTLLQRGVERSARHRTRTREREVEGNGEGQRGHGGIPAGGGRPYINS